VATQDTVTLIRSAIRALLRVVDAKLGVELRSCCKRDDDYVAPGKPVCEWDDAQARETLVDALARDAYAVLAALDGRTLTAEVTQAAALVATVVGQDLEQRDDGIFRIARRVAKDRVISTVDPEARHGHKTAARGFRWAGQPAPRRDQEWAQARARARRPWPLPPPWAARPSQRRGRCAPRPRRSLALRCWCRAAS
jgi:hypothetical protein